MIKRYYKDGTLSDEIVYGDDDRISHLWHNKNNQTVDLMNYGLSEKDNSHNTFVYMEVGCCWVEGTMNHLIFRDIDEFESAFIHTIKTLIYTSNYDEQYIKEWDEDIEKFVDDVQELRNSIKDNTLYELCDLVNGKRMGFGDGCYHLYTNKALVMTTDMKFRANQGYGWDISIRKPTEEEIRNKSGIEKNSYETTEPDSYVLGSHDEESEGQKLRISMGKIACEETCYW